jgi:quercetin dioxygenase-like cupin family protein
MKHEHYTDVKQEIPKEKGVKDTTIRWLISKNDGAENFAMRLFEIEPGGHTPYHQHDWEHEIFILEGKGIAKSKDAEVTIKQGDILFIEPNEWHQMKNTNNTLMKVICLIPYKK